MGEPAPPTASEASVLFDFARRVVRAVRDDEPAPQPRFPDGDAMPDETMIFKLAQLALAQLDENKRLLEECIKRNHTINAYKAEAEDRDATIFKLRREISQLKEKIDGR